ncbi:cupin domain-containing protein [Pseudoduganella namucuonensis]|uniref:Cupin domain-containing protein n=1 Tax=Pseudoduganella namucuonensis TaxID=1035707 RepID=A0A1I7LL02_9BURK|nr:cupin domain-containing protein [Pseudoduganella namucuonensis]SFV10309.1 Cupin domain-containing protein [Pseudoduganella namucuonensis]
MALQHASSGQAITLVKSAEDLSQFASIALVKTEQLELMRMVIPKGKVLPSHQVKGEVTLQCLQGELAITAHGRTTLLRAGEMLYLAACTPHMVQAEQDTLALKTILLRD